MKKNSFIYNENAKIGQVKMVESENNTTQIFKVKDESEPIFTLNVAWWDLDGINRAVKLNEKAIAKAVKTFVIDGCKGVVDKLADDMKKMTAEERNGMKLYVREKLGLR